MFCSVWCHEIKYDPRNQTKCQIIQMQCVDYIDSPWPNVVPISSSQKLYFHLQVLPVHVFSGIKLMRVS